MTVIAAILWLWLAVSIGIYGYRIYRRVTRGSQGMEEAEGTGRAGSDPNRPLGAASALIQNPVAGFDSPAAPADPSPPVAFPSPIAAPSSPPPVTAPEPLAAPRPPIELVPPTPNPPDPQLQPVWAAPAPGDLSASERRTARQPISDAVAGIRLPCDLAPLVGDASRLDPFNVSFFTTTHDGDSVHGALAGELVRLGYQVATTSAFRLGASRADAEVVVTIYPNPSSATEGGRPLYPTATQGSVVVRFQS